MSTTYEQRYSVFGAGDEIAAMDAVMARINQLCREGCSRRITLVIDGDGSAGIRIKSGTKLSNEDVAPDIEFDSEMEKLITEHENNSKKIRWTYSDKEVPKTEIVEIDEKGDMTVYIGE